MLTIDRATYDAIVAHARKDHPDEACGVVAGAVGSDLPTRFIPMFNAAIGQSIAVSGFGAGGRSGQHLAVVHDFSRAEFRFQQVSTFFGAPPPGKVTVWWYRDAAEKQRLVGAEHTQFAKPWRREVHVNGA